MTFLKTRAVPAALLALVALAFGSCTVKKTEVPDLAGPSETGLSLATSVTPDILDQDGLSQAVVEVVTRGPDARPVPNVPLRIEIRIGGTVVDFGRLSNKTPITGSDGVARVTYTAPPAPTEPVDSDTVVTLVVIPVGSDYHGGFARYLEVRLVPRGVILPPNSPPTFPADGFVVTPTPVTNRTPVTFDASGTIDEGSRCGTRCTYAWNFGDGTSATGMTVVHEFEKPGTFIVTLTVTDSRGATIVTSKAVEVEATPAPTADFIWSPTAPVAGQNIFFNAQSSKAAPGHVLVAYDWDFGSGRTGEGVTITKRYDTPGTYNVTLKVHDDTFQPTGTAVITKAVTVAVPVP
ncbi:MAG: PKD domain-containing protein [Vicinamibacterales bacterium]